jgi:hypothetical protein
MKISFVVTTFNSYLSGLKPPMSHFDKLVTEFFKKQKIQSSFDALEITFAYPPYIISKGMEKSEGETLFSQWYAQLPIVKFTKKRTVLNVMIAFPELSEYLEKNVLEKAKTDCREYVVQEIPQAYLNKTTTDILAALFEKIYEVIAVIESKIKKTDSFDANEIRRIWTSLKATIREQDLKANDQLYERQAEEAKINMTLQDRIIRKNRSLDKTLLIKDIRFMHDIENIDLLYFSPYNQQFCAEILDKLRERKFKCPLYTHLYINVSDTIENALRHGGILDYWFVYGIAVISNAADYKDKAENEQKKIVFNLIKEGLVDIATLDKLDMNTLQEVLADVEKVHLI